MQSATRYLIVENESLAREELSRSVRMLRPNWEYAGYAETIEEVVNFLKNDERINLVFMDIELDDGQCFEIFDRIETDVSIVFTTAYSEYALQAFHLNSLDYLLKPFSTEALENSIRKYERFTETQFTEDSSEERDNRVEISNPSGDASGSGKLKVPRVLIQQGDRYDFVPLEKVAWFESEDKYVFCIDVTRKKSITIFKTLKELEDALPAENFCKLRRNIIASISSIVSVHKFFKGSLRICLSAGETEADIVVPQTNKHNVLMWLGIH